MLAHALPWHAEGPPAPLVRGDELARELDIAGGPELGRLLAELEAAQFAGEIDTHEDAVNRARELLHDGWTSHLWRRAIK